MCSKITPSNSMHVTARLWIASVGFLSALWMSVSGLQHQKYDEALETCGGTLGPQFTNNLKGLCPGDWVTFFNQSTWKRVIFTRRDTLWRVVFENKLRVRILNSLCLFLSLDLFSCFNSLPFTNPFPFLHWQYMCTSLHGSHLLSLRIIASLIDNF